MRDSMTGHPSFTIDPDGTVRTAAPWPIAEIRNIEEIRRTGRTPLTSRAHDALTHEARHPSDRVIEFAPAISHEGAGNRDRPYHTIKPEFDK